jgi:hypothetical protein
LSITVRKYILKVWFNVTLLRLNSFRSGIPITKTPCHIFKLKHTVQCTAKCKIKIHWRKIKFLWGYKSLNVVDICFSSTAFQIKDTGENRYGVLHNDILTPIDSLTNTERCGIEWFFLQRKNRSNVLPRKEHLHLRKMQHDLSAAKAMFLIFFNAGHEYSFKYIVNRNVIIYIV